VRDARLSIGKKRWEERVRREVQQRGQLSPRGGRSYSSGGAGETSVCSKNPLDRAKKPGPARRGDAPKNVSVE